MSNITHIRKIYFIGIGGIGMSGLAIISKRMGYEVLGSDISESYITKRLKNEKIKVFLGHKEANLEKDVDLVVISSAIKSDNIELKKAQRIKIPIIPRAKFLSLLASKSKTIAVCGTHGKTTTTSMITSIFEASKAKYTSVIGGISKHIDSNIKFHKGQYFIIEADESDGSFLYYSPFIICVTNIDNDHLDFYKNLENIKKIFTTFINKLPFYGRAILCGDDKNIRDIIPSINAPFFTYGFNPENDWQIKNKRQNINGVSFEIFHKGKREALINLRVFGNHNILNATASYLTALYIGFDKKTITEGLLSFKGVKRRLDIIGKVGKTLFYDDYGHHPTEIKNTLASLRSFYPERKIIAIFQPHRYTRTKMLYKEFGKCFKDADNIYVTKIYPAGEKPIKGISEKNIIKELMKNGEKVFEFTSPIEIAKNIKNGDIVISIGAGDVYKILDEIKLKYESIVLNLYEKI
ncbi:MAG: UDP-N-acetylmuramate--L-alanine ligase [Elusimicrobiota bacterium]